MIIIIDSSWFNSLIWNCWWMMGHLLKWQLVLTVLQKLKRPLISILLGFQKGSLGMLLVWCNVCSRIQCRGYQRTVFQGSSWHSSWSWMEVSLVGYKVNYNDSRRTTMLIPLISRSDTRHIHYLRSSNLVVLLGMPIYWQLCSNWNIFKFCTSFNLACSSLSLRSTSALVASLYLLWTLDSKNDIIGNYVNWSAITF